MPSGIYERTIEHRQNISKSKKGKTPSNFLDIQKLAWESTKGKPMSLETKLKQSLQRRGEKSHLWQGGVTSINKLIRNSFEYRNWRTSVFERDNYTCVMCGLVGVYLQADHIKPFAYFPELRFDLDNGRTLCKKCHQETDTYMGRAKKHQYYATI